MFSRFIATSSTSNAYRFLCLRLVNFIFSNYTSKPFFVQANCMGEMYYNSRDAHSQNRTFRAPLLRNVHRYNSRDAHSQNRTFRAPLLRNVHCYNSRDAHSQNRTFRAPLLTANKVCAQLCFAHERASTSSCWSVKFPCKHEICPDLAWRVNCNDTSSHLLPTVSNWLISHSMLC